MNLIIISLTPKQKNSLTPVKNKKGFFPDDFFPNKEIPQLRQVRTPLINRAHINSNFKILTKNVIVAREKSKDKELEKNKIKDKDKNKEKNKNIEREKNKDRDNQILQKISFKMNKFDNINDNNEKDEICHTPNLLNNNHNFNFENIFRNNNDKEENNTFDNEEMKNDTLFKETPHFFPCIEDLKDEYNNNDINNYNKNNNKIEEEIEINYKNKEKHNTKNSNKNYVNNSNHNSNKKIFDSNKKYKINNNNIINNNNLHKKTISDRIKNKNEVSLPNVINENIVNKEIQNLFENIPNQLRNDPDLKEKVGELLNNINEMKAFIETKKEQKFKLKKNKSGNKEKIKLLNNKSENNLQNPKNEKNKNKQKVQVQMSQNNLINKRPPISERKINLLKNMNSNNNSNNNKNYNNNNHNNNNYNYNSIQKQIPHPSKINNIRYVDNNKI